MRMWYRYSVYDSEATLTEFELKHFISRQTIGRAKLEDYPGCPAIRIIREVKVAEQYQKNGFATNIISRIIQWAIESGVTELQATVNHLTPTMSKIFVKLGFTESESFVNQKSGNTIRLYKLRLQ